MTLTPIEVIRQACIRANPEILELKFGCHLRWLRGKKDNFVFLDTNPNGTLQVKFPNGTIGLRAAAFDDCEILGRPIRLADVLLALQEQNYKIPAKQVTLWLAQQEKIVCEWNLRQDSLESQSPEVLAFLASLLGE